VPFQPSRDKERTILDRSVGQQYVLAAAKNAGQDTFVDETQSRLESEHNEMIYIRI
jgi:hypothetical protein